MWESKTLLIVTKHLTLTLFIGLAFWGCEDRQEDGTTTFDKTYDGIQGHSVQPTTDGGYIITGYTGGNGYGYDICLIKTDFKGNEEWNKTFGGNGISMGWSIWQTTDGGYIISGHTDHIGNGGSDIWLIKTNSAGVEEWSQTFGGISTEGGNSVQQTIDGGYIIAGYTGSFGNGEEDIWLIKTNSLGAEEWSQTFGGSNKEVGSSIQQTTDEGFIITGRTSSYGNGKIDIWLLKTDLEGNEEWSQTFGGNENDWGHSVKQTSEGGYIITGYTDSFGNGGSDIYLIKTNSFGVEEWSQTFGGSGMDNGNSVQQTIDGGFIISGSKSENGIYAWLIKTNSFGIEEWSQIFDGSGVSFGTSVQQTEDDGYIITGSKWMADNTGNNSVWLMKTDSEGDYK